MNRVYCRVCGVYIGTNVSTNLCGHHIGQQTREPVKHAAESFVRPARGPETHIKLSIKQPVVLETESTAIVPVKAKTQSLTVSQSKFPNIKGSIFHAIKQLSRVSPDWTIEKYNEHFTLLLERWLRRDGEKTCIALARLHEYYTNKTTFTIDGLFDAAYCYGIECTLELSGQFEWISNGLWRLKTNVE